MTEFFGWSNKNKMIYLQSDRLIIRSFRETDLEAFSAYRSDPDVAKYQSWELPYKMDQAFLFLADINRFKPGTPGEWYQLAVERQGQPGIIGDVAFQINRDDPLQAEIGFTFDRSFQNQGYATEAVKNLLNFLFTQMNLHRVVAICDVENHASVRLLERIGMRREGHFIENVWFKGSWGCEYLYAILSSEWDK